MTFWAFGDSFMAYDTNYIRILGNSCNADNIKALGVDGSGLLFTYQRLLECKDKIQEDDVVLIGLSSTARFLFGEEDLHIIPTLDKDGVTNVEEHFKSNEQHKAVLYFMKHLYHDLHVGNLAHAVVSSIFHSIIPSFKTKRVSAVVTVGKNGYFNTFNLPQSVFKDTDLYDIAFSYLVNIKDYDPDNFDPTVVLANHNHWLEYDDYPDYFFSKLTRVLKELQIDKLIYE